MSIAKKIIVDKEPNYPIRVAFMTNGPEYPTGYCYDEETEVLTNNGWKLFKDVNEDDKIATVNTKTNQLEYHCYSEKIVEDYKGKMFHWKSQTNDLLVTPNHKVLVKKYDSQDNTWMLLEASEVAKWRGNSYQFKKSVDWIGEKIDKISIPRPEYQRENDTDNLDKIEYQTNKLLSLIGWYLAEGYTFNNEKNYRVHISQSRNSNPEKHQEIVDLITELGFTPQIYDDKADICFHSRAMHDFFQQFGNHSYDKKIPYWIKNANKEQLIILMNSYFNGDGYWIDKSGERMWCSCKTVSKQLADDIHEILIKCGLNGSMSIAQPMKREYSFESKRVSYSITVNHKKLKGLMPVPKEIDYDGKIYCLTVPNHTLCVRRHGKVVWSGNSHVLRSIVSRIAKDERFEPVIFNENWNSPEQREWNGIPVMGIPNKTGHASGVAEGFIETFKKVKPDIVWFLEDSFTLRNFGFEGVVDLPAKRVFYAAFDGWGVPSTGLNIVRSMDELVSMAKFGEAILDEEGFEATTIWHGVDSNVFHPVTDDRKADIRKKYGFAKDDFIIFNYGRNTNLRKNNQTMLEILCEYLKDAPNNHHAFLHIMNADNAELNLVDFLERVLQRKYGSEVISRIHWSPFRNYKESAQTHEVAEMIQMSDVTITCSLGEGFGLIMAESPACGVPVISTDYSTPEELLMDTSMGIGERGWVVPTAINQTGGLNVEHGHVDRESFVNTIKYVFDNPEERFERGLNGRAFAEKYLNWDYLVEEWKKLFINLVK